MAKKYKITFFSYSQDAVRQFNCNEIFFFANAGAFLINDVYTLYGTNYLNIRGQENETDTTNYKITVITGTLTGWYKTDISTESETITGAENKNTRRGKNISRYGKKVDV